MPVSNAAHGFDMFLYKDGQYPYAVEVKTKASSEKFNETGIEKYLYDRYATICDSLKMPLLLMFVDERLQSFYGEFFHKLQKPQTIGRCTYPKLVCGKGGKNPTYFFHVSTMRYFGDLRPLEVEYLKLMHERIKKVNKVFLSGNLTREVEVRYTQSGKAYARVGIAVNRPFSKDKAVDFFNLIIWDKSAEAMGKYLAKGSRILVKGRLQTSKYKDKDGNERTATEIIVENWEFADSKKKAADDFDGTPIDDSDTPF